MRRVLMFLCCVLGAVPAYATTYNPANGEALQALFSGGLTCGDIVNLTAGATYSRSDPSFYWQVEEFGADCSANPVIVRSAAYATITTPSGFTKTERDAWVMTNGALFAKIDTGRQEAFRIDPGVKGLRWIGIEWTTNGTTSTYTADIIALAIYGSGPGGYSTIAEKLATHDIVFERVFIHPAEVTSAQLTSLKTYRTSGRGLHWAGVNLTFKDSDCRGFGGMFYPTGIGTVATAPSPATSGTTMTLQAGHAAALLAAAGGGTDPFGAMVWAGGGESLEASTEMVRVTNVNTTTNVITFERNIPDNNKEVPVARSIQVGDKIGWATVVDAYCVYNDGSPSTDILITNNYLEAHTMTSFTGGGSTTYAQSATLTAGATSTTATFSNVTSLMIGDLIALQVPSYTPPTSDHASIWKSAEVTNIVGNVVTYKGFGVTPIDEAPTTPGLAIWDGYNIERLTVSNNLLWKIDQFGGRKGHLEFKSCFDCVIESNLAGGDWASDFALTPHNQDGGQPWTRISGMVFRYNKLYNQSRFFTVQGFDPEYSSLYSDDILVEQNLSVGGCNDAHLMTMYVMGATGLVVRHNTLIEDCSSGTNSAVFTPSKDVPGFTFQDNIVWSGNSVMNCTIPPNTENTCWPSKVKSNNVIVNTTGNSDASVLAANPSDFIESNTAGVGFINAAGGNWGLAPGTSHKGGQSEDASDGTDVGVNCALLPGGDCMTPVSGGGGGGGGGQGRRPSGRIRVR